MNLGAKEIYVIGHRTPDVDAVIASSVLAHMMRERGLNAIEARAGELNPSIKFVLGRTGVREPTLITDVRPRVADVMTRNVKYVTADVPVKHAIDLLISLGVRSAPVVDEHKRVIGIFSTSSFARSMMSELGIMRLTLSGVPIKNVVEVVGCEILVQGKEAEVSGRVFVASMSVRTIESSYDLRGNVLLVGDREDVQLKAIELGVSLLIITGGKRPSEEVLRKARERGVTVLLSRHDTYMTARLLDLSRPVKEFSEKAETVYEDTLVSELRDLMTRKLVRSVVVIDEAGKLRGIVTRSDLVKDYRKKVALVDHNELSQAVEGIEEADVVAVVDHHRVSGDIVTRSPILFRIEPVGATCTILWRIAKEWGVTVPKNLAEAMLYAILTDTLLLKSPTTTEDDERVVSELLNYVGLSMSDATDTTKEIMSLDETLDPKEIVTKDIKEFAARGVKFAIAQIFTVRPLRYIQNVEKIIEYMDSIRKQYGYAFLALLITDFIERSSYIIAVGRKSILEEALGVDLSKGYAYLAGIVSRKAQVVPKIIKVLERE
ncbi:MAG: putative manganese-dependent inorganic diphosphatase [Desulfurococcales archaeon]|nr:putative manganese-dependent inorganic diphosphatase [Desulfurococcales archaeon]